VAGSGKDREMYFIIQIIFMVVLFFMSAFFSSIDAALMSLPRMRIKRMMGECPKKAKALKVWLDNPNKYLTALLLGNDAVTVIISAFATSIVVNISKTYGFNDKILVPFTAFFVWCMLLVFGEVSPKIVGIHNSEKIVKYFVNYVYYFNVAISPLSRIFVFIGSAAIGGGGKKELPVITGDDIRTAISVGHEMGILGMETKQMLHAVLNFPQITAKSIMVPLSKIEAVNIDTEKEKFIDLLIETGHARVPVFRDNIDNIMGLIHTRDMLGFWRSGDVFHIEDFIRPVITVREEEKITNLMKEFKKGETHMAIIKNAKGNVVGLITIEDIIEEVFGEILDEYDLEDLFQD